MIEPLDRILKRYLLSPVLGMTWGRAQAGQTPDGPALAPALRDLWSNLTRALNLPKPQFPRGSGLSGLKGGSNALSSVTRR